VQRFTANVSDRIASWGIELFLVRAVGLPERATRPSASGYLPIWDQAPTAASRHARWLPWKMGQPKHPPAERGRQVGEIRRVPRQTCKSLEVRMRSFHDLLVPYDVSQIDRTARYALRSLLSYRRLFSNRGVGPRKWSTMRRCRRDEEGDSARAARCVSQTRHDSTTASRLVPHIVRRHSEECRL